MYLRRLGRTAKRINAMRGVRREERGGEGRERIATITFDACNLKSSAQKVSQHRLRDFSFEAQIIPKCSQNRPRELRNPSPEHPKSSRGAPTSSRGAPKSIPGAPRSPKRAPQAPKSSPRCVQRVSEGPFGKHFGTIWASKLRSRSRCWLTF